MRATLKKYYSARNGEVVKAWPSAKEPNKYYVEHANGMRLIPMDLFFAQYKPSEDPEPTIKSATIKPEIYVSNLDQVVVAYPSPNQNQFIVRHVGIGMLYSRDLFQTQFKPFHPNEQKAEPIMAKKATTPAKPAYKVRPKKYVSAGGRIVRGIKVTEKNYAEIVNWIDAKGGTAEAIVDVAAKTGDLSGHRVKIRTPKGIRVARVGEWVATELDAKNQPTTFFVFKDDFDAKYTAL